MPKKQTKLYYFDTPEGKDIAKRFFLEYTNQTKVSKDKHPKSSGIHPYINKLFKFWKEKSFFENKIIGYQERKNKSKGKTTSKYPKKRYRLNLKFFLNHLQDKGVKFTKLEKEIVDYIFSFREMREMACKFDKLDEGILSILERIFLFKVVLEEYTPSTEFIKGFLVNNQRYLKKGKNPEDQYEIFWRKELKLNEEISNKIGAITSLLRGDFMTFLEPVKKYSQMPAIIPHYVSTKEKEKLMKRWSIVFYENRELKDEELF